MKKDYVLRAVCATLALAFVVFAAQTMRAQAIESTPETEQSGVNLAPPVAQMFDEYGRVGHCDWTARLDHVSAR